MITLAQKKAGPQTTASPITTTLDTAPSVGDLMVMSVVAYGVAGGSLEAPGWIEAASSVTGSTWHKIFFKLAGVGESANCTADISGGGTATAMRMHVIVYRGALQDSANVLDKVVTASDAGTVTSLLVGPTAITTQAAEMAVCSVDMSSTHGGLVSVSDGFAAQLSASVDRMITSDKRLATLTTPQCTTTWTTGRTARGIIATFKAAPVTEVPRSAGNMGSSGRLEIPSAAVSGRGAIG